MGELICMVGLPRSGKTTLALTHGAPIVCPDAIRLACHARAYFAPFEPWTWAMAYTMAEALFQAGHREVIFDATNNTRKRRDALRLQGDTFGEHPDMCGWTCRWWRVNTPADVCIERADASLIPVIERMAAQVEPLAPEEGDIFEAERCPP